MIHPKGSTPCSGCSTSCALIPPPGVKFPCYQGKPSDAIGCYKTDPLLKPNTTWGCGTCVLYGYAFYIRNDPIYTKMELWSKKPASLRG